MLGGQAGRRRKPLSVNRGPEFPTPEPPPQLRLHAHPTPAAPARAVTSSRGSRPPGRTAHGVGAGSQASCGARRPGTAGARQLAHLGKRRWETTGMREVSWRRRRAAGFVPGTRSGSPGWSGWGAVGRPGCPGEGGEGDGERARRLGRAGLLLEWEGPGGRILRLCWTCPTELRDFFFLSEDELKPPRRQRAMSYPKLGTRSEHTPGVWGQFSLRDENIPVCQAARKGRPVILLSCSHQQPCGAGIIMWSLIFPSGNPGQSNFPTGYTAEKRWSCSFL